MKHLIMFILGKQKQSILNIWSKKHTIAVLSLVCGFIITLIIGIYSNKVHNDISGSLLRLHIIANSDTKEDQTLKLKVRDAIIAEMTEKFKNSKNIDETKQIALNNLNNIKEIAKKVIMSNGKDYAVKVSLADSYFPTKYYGDIVLPTGSYDALKVEIGQATGQNWWCVLFPPLCFVDATNGQLPESSKEKLKEALSEEEYQLISTANINDNVPVKIKFKSVEIWQQSKHKVQVAIDNFNK